ncbi:MAG: hypothetical protein FRX49_10592 [Trebouxia sp. A1-2]|nr:MAG: hypothetical protein FRX49_10592 [Trebouxia sp. A1-2]
MQADKTAAKGSAEQTVFITLFWSQGIIKDSCVLINQVAQTYFSLTAARRASTASSSSDCLSLSSSEEASSEDSSLWRRDTTLGAATSLRRAPLSPVSLLSANRASLGSSFALMMTGAATLVRSTACSSSSDASSAVLGGTQSGALPGQYLLA